jgi:hypothetical protein
LKDFFEGRAKHFIRELVSETAKLITGGAATIKKRVTYHFDEEEEMDANNITMFEEIGWKDPFTKLPPPGTQTQQQQNTQSNKKGNSSPSHKD